jgi:(1->4)-alpha-D-glucan 1-alpha-D-glucosylmutase
VLLLRVSGSAEAEFVMRFQQLTAPVTAKGVEDTAFYAYNRLVALNEVGGDPSAFCESLAGFHADNLAAAQHWPGRMLASSTHDTKRSEDVRVRIGLLSEMPDRWRSSVERWREMNARKRSSGFPDRNTEYLIYQTLVGAWPITSERLVAYAQKATREAKRFTSWTDSKERYETAVTRFIERCLRDDEFTAEVEQLVAEITPAWHVTSLAQTLLRLTCVGVPDVYQGTELWDLSLVDPDNRRPVDFDLRDSLLDRAGNATPEDVLADAASGLPKIWLIKRALDVRSRRPELFAPGASYHALTAQGPQADRVVAFVRGGEAVSVVPRFNLRSASDGWADTQVELARGDWHNELTGERFEGGPVRVDRLLDRFPVALLVPAVP